MSKQFHIGDIISVTTGHLVSPSHIGGVYGILNYMTRDDLFTHQLPRASEQCAPYLVEQYPFLSKERLQPQLDELIAALKGVETNDAAMVLVRGWLTTLPKQVPGLAVLDGLPFDYMVLRVDRVPLDDYTHKNPVEELQGMVGKERVIVVEVPEGEADA